MKAKFVLLGVAILAVGLMVMPYTVNSAWYTGGSHYWSRDGTVDANNWNQTHCNKCHGSTTGDDTSNGAAAFHADKACSFCHAPAAANSTQHTNISIPSCLQAGCHVSDIASNFTSGDEPHFEMYRDALSNNNVSKPASRNEACIACHTGVDVTVTFNWEETNETITIEATGGAAGWTLVDYS